ncbi:MAG: class IV adenylate cyclase [Chloroflexi bacterium]|nr:class IV adenylate cyclase [Chloroflexota bacterium]
MAAYTETEVKLYVPDLDAVRARLEAMGARLSAQRVYERNIRYDDAAGTFDSERIVLRLRQDTRVRLTYKADTDQVAAGDAKVRFEAEVEVSDFDAMHTILGKLGFSPFMIYEKYRTTYTLGAVEVMLDELPYGSFVEIEGEAEAIMQARQQLDLHDAPSFTASYTTLFKTVCQRLSLDFTDLTFANFAGVTVPLSAFTTAGAGA